MAESYVVSCRYLHSEFGTVCVRVVPNARTLRARWEGPELHVTIPPRLSLSRYEQFLQDFHDELIALRPPIRFAPGTIIDGGECDFEIASVALPPRFDMTLETVERNCARGKEVNYILMVRDGLFTESDPADTEVRINRVLLGLAGRATKRFVIPRAKRLAEEIGSIPAKWDVRHHKRDMGQCTPDGKIILGARLIFLPHELRDYIIYHELAHLVEMNHSARFHRLCNSYCAGREAELYRKYRSFVFPVF